MAGTIEGGRKAARKNKKLYGKDFYAKIGAKGGRNGHTGGFYYYKIRGLKTHVELGRIGGLRSKRGKEFVKETMSHYVYRDKKTGERVKVKKV